MKILHTSDWHLGKSLYDFSLLDDQRETLEFMLGLIEREKIGAVIIAGDIFDRPVPSADAVRLYDSFLTRAVLDLGVPVIAVAGNHDSASRLEFGSGLYAGSGYHIFGSPRTVQEPVVLRDEFGEIFFHPLPWLHPAEVRAQFDDAKIKTFDSAYRAVLGERAKGLDPSARNIAIAHGFFADLSGNEAKEMLTSDSELNVGGMDIADSSSFSAFDYTALGHLHAPQRAGERVFYSGSPLKYSLSEEKQRKSCVIAELRQKSVLNTELIPIPASRDLRTVTGNFDELMDPSFHKNQAPHSKLRGMSPLATNTPQGAGYDTPSGGIKYFDDYVFANILDGHILYPMEKLRTLFPNLLGLRFITSEDGLLPEEIQANSSPKPGVLELFKRFYRDSKSAEMPQDRVDFLSEIMEKSEVEE